MIHSSEIAPAPPYLKTGGPFFIERLTKMRIELEGLMAANFNGIDTLIEIVEPQIPKKSLVASSIA